MSEREETMVKRVGRAMAWADLSQADRDMLTTEGITADSVVMDDHIETLAIAAVKAMRDPSHDMMRAIFEAMFEEKFDGTTAPMIGAGWDAGIDAALKEHEGEKS